MNKKIFVPLALLILVAVGMVGFSDVLNNQSSSTLQPSNEEATARTVSVSIENITDAVVIDLIEGDTALSVLNKLAEKSSFEVRVKEYSGLGTLVQGIGEYENGVENKYWQYTVNNVMPQVGADALALAPGDHVVWEFKESEF